MIQIQPILKRARLFLITAFLILMSNAAFSQALSCPSIAIIPRSGTVTVNGVTITSSYAGDVYAYTDPTTTCTGQTMSAGSLWVGPSVAWSVTLQFDTPVNNLVLLIGGTGFFGNENFIFNSNGGSVSIFSDSVNCFSTISGNQILSGQYTNSATGSGGGLFKITSPNNFTSLTLNGDGGHSGSMIGFCSASLIPACNAGTAGSNQTITSGTSPAALSLTGSNGTIQWQSSLDNSTYTDISGANSTSYSPGVLSASRYYRAVATSGGCTSTSNVVTITAIPDSDGDGIRDDVDLDDDNDGILDTNENICETEGSPSYSNDFGTGTSITTDANVVGHTFQSNGPFDGFYAVTSGPSQTGYPYAQADGNKDAGYFDISAGSTNGKYLMINVASNYGDKVLYRVPNITVTPGTKYRFRLDLAGLSAGAATIPKLQIVIKDGAGNVLGSVDSGNIGMANDDIWRRASMIFTPTLANVSLEIINQQPINTDGNDVGIDNFVLAPYIACDTDGDGIPNSLDLDSDNDGCPDSREGAGNFNPTNTASGTISTQTPNTNFGTAVNTTTGIPTAVGGGQGVGQSQNSLRNDCLDSDSDTIPNWEDLDDDNDGILDTDEDCFGYRAQNTNGSWLGDTTSTLNLTTNTATQTFVTSYSDRQNNYWVNQNGGQQRLFRMNASSHNLTYTFSSGVPASEIAFMIEDVDPSITDGSTNVEFTILINGQPSTAFAPTILNGSGIPMNYNPSTGKINLSGSANDQLIMLKGFGSTVVNSITLTTTGTGSLDAIAYSVFAYKKCDTDGDGISNHLDLDSDNDGCSDAIEGASTTITNSNLVDSSMPGGNSGATSGSHNQPIIKNLGNTVNTTLGSASYGVPTIAGSGQAIGSSQNTLINGCFCYEDPALVAGATYPVKQGITILGRAGKVSTGAGNTTSDWPMVRNSAYTALESKTKGFVITRNSSPETTIAIPVVGMMVFDTNENAGAGCMKIYTGSGAGEGWKCFNTQTCP